MAFKIARVFPRRTRATPTDSLTFVGDPPLIRPEIDEVHVSVTFTWDLPEAERLADSWGRFYPVKVGGPATGVSGLSGPVPCRWCDHCPSLRRTRHSPGRQALNGGVCRRIRG